MKVFSHIHKQEQATWPAALANQYELWRREVQSKRWECFPDVQDFYPDVESPYPQKLVFHVLRGKAIIYVHVEYDIGYFFVKFVGMKEEFDKLFGEKGEVDAR